MRPAAATLAVCLLLAEGGVRTGETPPSSEGRPPWYEGFALRRRISLPKGAAGGDAVLLRIGTSRRTQEDARDVRVVLEHRYPIPVEILEAGPGDTALIRFEVVDPEREHHLYLGSPGAARPRMPRKAARKGLLLEVLALGEGSEGSGSGQAIPARPASAQTAKAGTGFAETWDEARRLLRDATSVGWAAPRSIFLGIPPLGQGSRAIARYTGHLRIEEEGSYTFETVSDGASFFLVGGKVVASWPGDHGIGGYADPEKRKERSGEVRLAAGAVPFEYLVATRRGGVHLLAWTPPGETRARPVPPGGFVPWLAPALGPAEARAQPWADFDWEIASDTGSDAERHDLAEVEFRFAGDLKGRRPRRVRWSFGDGQEAEGESVRHVYLRHGTYEVTATGQVSNELSIEAVRTVAVRFEDLERRDLDALLERYREATRGYDLTTLPPEHIERLVWLLAKDDRWEGDLERALDAWFARDPRKTPSAIEAFGLDRAAALVRRGEDSPSARRILENLSSRASERGLRDEATAWLARFLARSPGERDAAAKLLEDVRSRAGTRAGAGEGSGEGSGEGAGEGSGEGTGEGASPAGRRAAVFLADLRILQGREGEAREIVERLDAGPRAPGIPSDRNLARGARSVAFDGLLREGRLEAAADELDRWEYEVPEDLLTGAVLVARARLLIGKGAPDEAIAALERVGKLERAGREKPRSLLLLAEALGAKGDAAAARKRLEEVVRDFPLRPEAREAEARLAAPGPPAPGR